MKTVLLQLFDPSQAKGQLSWQGGAGAGLMVMDRAGWIKAANEHASGLVSQHSPLDGRLFLTLFTPDCREGVAQALAAGGSAPGPIVVKTASQVPYNLELRFEPAEGGDVRVMMLDRSFEERQTASLREETAVLRDDVGEAQAQVTAGADLLADLSHEMRTPLNAVIGFAEAMQNETFGPLGHVKYSEYADHIRNSGGHLMELISAILDLARIDAGRMSLNREMVDLRDIAYECAAMIEKTTEDAGLSLSVNIEDDLPETLLDPRAVRQILINLLGNAVKFTSHGGIDVSVARDGDALQVKVTDTGIGMNEKELASLGSRFAAVSSDGVRGSKGAGLGLALCFALAQAHNGTLSLDSAPGEGMVATLRLPITSPVARPIGRNDQPADETIVHSQLDRIAAYRRELAAKKSAA